jgi:mycothiol synthase
MLTMPRELVIRAPIQDDVHAVRDLIDACAQFDGNPQGVSLAELQTFWQMPGFDLARDAWVIDSPDERTAGYLDLYCPAPHDHIYADGWVHPDYRGLGIGRTLVQRAEARARELMAQAPSDARVALYVGAHSGNLAAARLFEREGFSLVRHFWRMSIALHDEPEEPAWPEGITLRGMRAGREERRVYEAKEEAFQDHYDHRALDYETWLRLNTADRETYDPSLWFVAEEGSEIVGVAICRPRTQASATEGWIGSLGVRRPWRQRGIGEALLRHALRAFYRRGQRSASLSVDASSLTGATRLYERAGMRVVSQLDRYEKVLREG